MTPNYHPAFVIQQGPTDIVAIGTSERNTKGFPRRFLDIPELPSPLGPHAKRQLFPALIFLWLAKQRLIYHSLN